MRTCAIVLVGFGLTAGCLFTDLHQKRDDLLRQIEVAEREDPAELVNLEADLAEVEAEIAAEEKRIADQAGDTLALLGIPYGKPIGGALALVGTGIYGRRRKKAGKPILPAPVTGVLALAPLLLDKLLPKRKAPATRKK